MTAKHAMEPGQRKDRPEPGAAGQNRKEGAQRDNGLVCRAIFDGTFELIGILTIDGTVLEANRAALQFIGARETDVIGKPFWETPWWSHSAEMQDRLRKEIHNAATGQFVRFDTTHRAVDGTLRYIDFSIKPFADSKGKVTRLIVEGREITEKKRLEKLQYERERWLCDILEGLPIPQFVIGKDHRVIFWNKAVEKCSGIRTDDIVGTDQHWRAFFAEKKPCMVDFIVDGREDEIPGWYDNEYRESRVIEGAYEGIGFYPVMGDRGMWLHCTASAIRNVRGEIIAAVETLENITDRKAAEEALRESEEKFRVLAETSPAAIFLYQGTKFVYVNPAAERLTRYPKEELLKMDFWDWIHPDYRESIKACGVSRLHGAYEPHQLEFKFITRDGKERWGLVSSGLIEYRGQPGGIGTFLDITELKRSQEALDDAKNQAELYLDLMGHDINNINHAAMGYLEMALEMLNPRGHERELLVRPMELMKNSSALIDNLKRIKQVRSGDISFGEIDLGIMLLDVVSRFLPIEGRDVRINFKPATRYLVEANKLLEHAFFNIIDNAIRHSDGPLAVDISIDRVRENAGTYYRIAFEDNGPGMPDEQKQAVFSHVTREKAMSSRIGLGLQLVKTLVEAFHGDVRAEDRVPGNYRLGCRIVIMLPAAEQ